jgi:hypothetical protein
VDRPLHHSSVRIALSGAAPFDFSGPF